MNYWDMKKERSITAQSHHKAMEESFANEIKASAEKSTVYELGNTIPYDTMGKENGTKFTAVFRPMTIQDYLTDVLAKKKKKYQERTVVLNFASYKNPGGKYLEGSSAQEESLCSVTTLYEVLLRNEDYYTWNREHLDRGLYKDRALISPDIIIDDHGVAIGKTNVITCAAPNKGAALKNGVSEDECDEAQRERIRFVMNLLRDKYTHLVLGAFGCGVFGNNPEVTAKAFLEELNTLQDECTVTFVIPDRKTMQIFQDVFFQEIKDSFSNFELTNTEITKF